MKKKSLTMCNIAKNGPNTTLKLINKKKRFTTVKMPYRNTTLLTLKPLQGFLKSLMEYIPLYKVK